MIATLTTISVLAAAPALAQQRQVDVHASYARGTASKTNAWGGGANLQLTFGGSTAPVKLGTSLGYDYTKQEHSGPSTSDVSYDVTLQPGGSGTVTPYAGGSVSANWSGGDAKAWDGAKLGLEALGGVQVKLGAGSDVAMKAEERFGYVRTQEHTLTTRFGVVVSF